MSPIINHWLRSAHQIWEKVLIAAMETHLTGLSCCCCLTYSLVIGLKIKNSSSHTLTPRGKSFSILTAVKARRLNGMHAETVNKHIQINRTDL